MTAQAATSVQSFVVPRTVEEALEYARDLGADAAYLAGGTDLGVVMRRRVVEPTHLIDLTRVDELRRLERDDTGILIGGGVTHRAIELSALFDGHCTALAEACATVGSIQTRNVGTVGGNLCNASPAADTATALLALRASVEVAGTAGRRTIALDDFFVGYRRTALEPGEILVAIRVPVPTHDSGSAFIKLGRRAAMEISIACAAIVLETADGVGVDAAGVGLGSVAAVPVRSRAAESHLAGSHASGDTWQAAGEAAVDDCAPIDDVRASGVYRRAMIPLLVARAAAQAFDRARSHS